MDEIHAAVVSPITGENTSSVTLVELFDRLDRLWIKYLSYLDSYATAQQTIQKQLSTGYLSLARANFTARNGQRYGRDYYHERAFATRRVQIEMDEDSSMHTYTVKWTEPFEESKEDQAAEYGTSESSPSLADPVSDSLPDVKYQKNTVETASSDDLQKGELEDATSEVKAKPLLEADPLRWFGLLVARELRDAQSSFSTIFESPVADAVNAARGMRDIEAQIRKTRKDIRRAEKAGLQ